VPTAIAPAGDISLSLGNNVRFVQLHLRGLRGSPSLAAPATFARLHQFVGDYALGWAPMDADGASGSFHLGDAGTFDAAMGPFSETDRGVVGLANADGQAVEDDVVRFAVAALAASLPNR